MLEQDIKFIRVNGQVVPISSRRKNKAKKKSKYRQKEKKSTTGKQQLRVCLFSCARSAPVAIEETRVQMGRDLSRRNYEPYDLAAHKKKYARAKKDEKPGDFQSHATDMAVTNAEHTILVVKILLREEL